MYINSLKKLEIMKKENDNYIEVKIDGKRFDESYEEVKGQICAFEDVLILIKNSEDITDNKKINDYLYRLRKRFNI